MNRARRQCLQWALLGAAPVGLLACSSTPPVDPDVRTDVIDANYRAADALLEGLMLDRKLPLLVATFVNLEVLTESSRLGRLFSELVGSRLAQRGYLVKELKLRESLFMKQSQGALLLSREVREISQNQEAQAVIVGTYTQSSKMLYLSVKLVLPEGNVVLSAHDYAMPLDTNLKGLLR
ncbi:FlgO family outer membrane protein [Curvibacter sp. HBC61]|uniref:FlgO family outer membrane protein n=1 Tax=Curvibacter cyanobacteriorum TaxID=3026422 RepID=A0ABT5N4L4_9BURK|nr:FlgO family outer membrane protein [Curvibacter sp. HBC61]MDD0841085.1 FlgO family outer membrane protein [Curvibacter sp. HBC61]